MFPLVKDFYFTNKEKIIDSRMGNNISFDEEEINSYVESIQGIVDNVFLTPMDSKEKFLVNRR